MIQILIFVILFLKNVISGIQLFYIRPRVPVFFYSRFSSRKSQNQQKLAKISLILQDGFAQKISNLNSLGIESKMLMKQSQKPFSRYKFSSKHVSVWCLKKHLLCTISWRLRTSFLKHFESKRLYIFVYFPSEIFVPKT